MARNQLLKYSRLVHLYLGVFITPALLFFAFTGAVQSFGLHETNRDHPDYKPARWLVVLGQLHKKQTTIVPVRRPQPPGPAARPDAPAARLDAPAPNSAARPDRPRRDPAAPSAVAPQNPQGRQDTGPANATPPAGPPAPKRHPLPLRIFFLIVSVGLFISSITGLYMSYKYHRKKLVLNLLVLAGIVIPILLIFV